MIYGGISIDSSPSGPLICTVDMGCVLVPLPLVEGATMLKVTPCGTDSGAEPIFDWHGEVVVKVLDTEVRANAGSRKVGIESECCCVKGPDANWAHRRRAGANMMLMLQQRSWRRFLEKLPTIYRLSHPESRDTARRSGCGFRADPRWHFLLPSLHNTNFRPSWRRRCTIAALHCLDVPTTVSLRTLQLSTHQLTPHRLTSAASSHLDTAFTKLLADKRPGNHLSLTTGLSATADADEFLRRLSLSTCPTSFLLHSCSPK
jgi:hypothetical protein